MSKQNTIVSERQNDGTLVQVMPDGSRRPLKDKTDWKRLGELTEEQVLAAASSDPDAQPVTNAGLARMKSVPRVKTLRRALHLSQEEFASRYHLPVTTLREWELGRCELDQIAHAYLVVIANDPEGVRRALEHSASVPGT